MIAKERENAVQLLRLFELVSVVFTIHFLISIEMFRISLQKLRLLTGNGVEKY